jgi:PAS domain S-box-containing protein
MSKDARNLAFLKDRVAELEAKQALLQAENDHFRQLYERAPLSYQSLDENGCCIEINQTWLENLGYSREEVIGKKFSDFIHPETGGFISKRTSQNSKPSAKFWVQNSKCSGRMAPPLLFPYMAKSAEIVRGTFSKPIAFLRTSPNDDKPKKH